MLLVTVKTENGDDNKAYEKSDKNSNGVPESSEADVKNERENESSPGSSKPLDGQTSRAEEDDAAPADVDAKQIATVNAKIQKLSSKLNQKSKPPRY